MLIAMTAEVLWGLVQPYHEYDFYSYVGAFPIRWWVFIPLCWCWLHSSLAIMGPLGHGLCCSSEPRSVGFLSGNGSH